MLFRREGVGTISAVALRALRDLVSLTPEELAKRKLTAGASEELARIIRPFVEYHLPRRLHSAVFLDEMG